MTNLNKKYKDRTPEQTIEIIKNFFESKNLEIRIVINEKSEANTWYCRIELYQNNCLILGTNGKGTTEQYSLASGYAELYERFCNRYFYMVNPYMTMKMDTLNKYLFNKDEINSTTQKQLEYNFISNFYNKYIGNQKDIDLYFQAITNNNIKGIEYIPFNNNKSSHFIDPRILIRTIGTIGMSAGNSVEEALNQGISEICEVYCRNNFFDSTEKLYYIIDKKYIKNPNLLEIINTIESIGYKLYIFDLSYIYKLPVLMSVLINPYQNNLSINFGSFPIFDIALERILTELYQGIDSYKNKFLNLQKPYKSIDSQSYMFNFMNSLAGISFIPEEIFTNIKYCNYNTDIFIDDNEMTNYDLNIYYKNLFQKLNLNFYYHNWSMSQDMIALQIYCEDFDLSFNKYQLFKYTNKNFKHNAIEAIYNIQQLIYNSIYNPNAAINNCNNLQNIYKELYQFNHQEYYIGNLMLNDWSYPDSSNNDFKILTIIDIFNEINLNKNQFFNISFQIKENDYIAKELKKYLTLYNYFNTKNYSYQEIAKFLSYLNIDISIEDYENITNFNYWLNKIYINNVQNIFNSENYKNYISLYIN